MVFYNKNETEGHNELPQEVLLCVKWVDGPNYPLLPLSSVSSVFTQLHGQLRKQVIFSGQIKQDGAATMYNTYGEHQEHDWDGKH